MNISVTKLVASVVVCALVAGCSGPERQPIVIGPSMTNPEVEGGISTRAAPDAAIRVGSRTRSVAIGEGAIWVLRSGKLLKIDPASNQVLATFPKINGPPAAVGEGAVWIIRPFWLSFRLQKIDTHTGQVLAIIPTSAQSVAVGAGSVWVTNPRNGTVSRIDPRTDQVISTVRVGRCPFPVAVGEGAVWVLNWEDGTVSRIDYDTDTVVATVPLGVYVGGSGLAVGDGGVWVRKGDHLLFIDPASNQVVRVSSIGHRTWGGRVWGVAAGGGAVWMTSRDRVSKVDPQSGRVVEQILIPGNEEHSLMMAAGESALWLIRDGGDTLWRIDFLTTVNGR